MATVLASSNPLGASGDSVSSVSKSSATTSILRKTSAPSADRRSVSGRNSDLLRGGGQARAAQRSDAQVPAPGNAPAQAHTQQSLAQPHQDIESTGGWDAYEVWRRFIKDARDRRRRSAESS